MKLTNKYGLPKTFENAIERDPYSMGNARISVTGLLRPPQITLLHKRHSPDIETDVTDHIYSLMGRAVHHILEQGGDEEHIPEERLFATVRGWIISGAMDLQKLANKTVAITDYKNCSAWAVMNEKPEWEYQLNSYRWLLETCKPEYTVSKLAICAIIRDWSRHEAARNLDYPQAPAVMVPIPLWPMDAAAKFIECRVQLHQEAQAGWDMGDDPPPCTDQDRWMREDKWAVWRKGNKRPTKVFDNEKHALQMVDEMEGRGSHFIEHRPGAPIRCTGNYCQVAGWCKQYAQWVKLHGG